MMDSELAAETFNSGPSAGILSSSGSVAFDMETLLLSFPNLWAFQNNEAALTWYQALNIPANSPPLGPNIRRLVLSSHQPRQLEYITRMLREFPNLEWFYFDRKPPREILTQWQPDDEFSNADVFGALHDSLRVLRYTGTVVTQHVNGGPGNRPWVAIDSFSESHLSDVPRFRGFRRLERLSVDQVLLGRMATLTDYKDWPVGPHFPDLDWRLPESLHRLTIRYVHDWPTLAGQLVPLAIAKRAGGQFPMLKDIFVVIVDSTTVESTGTWPLEIPLRGSYEPVIVSTGLLLREAGIKLSVSTEQIGPDVLDEFDEDPADLGTPIEIVCFQSEF
ncbi:hypothetical protein KVR01_009522 [Diaporthe batatas]|uniref:uncharacterized protein n=1 Tax=Diaporthe batatas TaxID=748121 RepID=UPI001D04D272|nr:uncharacterized protein KVR01_009522 [Diaporthe batatas]KAG8161258.1 hypothetical protein KVR01_009522 [Diaporthe batatas]